MFIPAVDSANSRRYLPSTFGTPELVEQEWFVLNKDVLFHDFSSSSSQKLYLITEATAKGSLGKLSSDGVLRSLAHLPKHIRRRRSDFFEHTL